MSIDDQIVPETDFKPCQKMKWTQTSWYRTQKQNIMRRKRKFCKFWRILGEFQFKSINIFNIFVFLCDMLTIKQMDFFMHDTPILATGLCSSVG